MIIFNKDTNVLTFFFSRHSGWYELSIFYQMPTTTKSNRRCHQSDDSEYAWMFITPVLHHTYVVVSVQTSYVIYSLTYVNHGDSNLTERPLMLFRFVWITAQYFCYARYWARAGRLCIADPHLLGRLLRHYLFPPTVVIVNKKVSRHPTLPPLM